MTFARFDAFARGVILGMHRAGSSEEEIRKAVPKKDGSLASLRAVAAVVAKSREDAEWRGEDSACGGRPRLLTKVQEKQVERLVFKERGQAKVTVPFCRKRLPFLRIFRRVFASPRIDFKPFMSSSELEPVPSPLSLTRALLPIKRSSINN